MFTFLGPWLGGCSRLSHVAKRLDWGKTLETRGSEGEDKSVVLRQYLELSGESAMACSYVPNLCGCPSTAPTTRNTLAPNFSFSFHPSIGLLERSHANRLQRAHAKFEKFQSDDNVLSSINKTVLQQKDEDEEDDSCLPPDLEGAVLQSSEATAVFVSSGGMRAIVELLIPQLQFLDDEGAQGELWELSRVFLDALTRETGCQRVKAVFPDAGAAALLKYKWKDAAFGFSSLSDRKPVQNEDEIVVMVVPDYQMLGYVEKIAAYLSDDPPRPLIMWNPRLVSEDVGVGFNVRRLRRNFLSTFTTVYSMRPLAAGAVFRCYPGSWKVFYDDKERANRYLLAKEQISRPDADELEIIFGDVQEGNSENNTSLSVRVAALFSSLNRFMKVISR